MVGELVMSCLETVNKIVREGYALKTLSELMSEEDDKVRNISELENIVNLLEIHEAEVRMIRQNLKLRLRNCVLESYLDDKKKYAL